MPSFVTVTSGATAQAQDVNQLITALNGTAGQGVPISLTALNDSVNFALALKNADPTNSRSLQVLRSNNNVLIQADASGVIVSPDGGATTGQVLTVNATQTLTNKTLTAPTMTSVTVSSGGIIASGGITLSTGNLVVTAGSAALTVGPLTIGGTVAAGGSVRLASNVGVNWRNNANTADVGLLFDAADKLNVTTAAGNVGAVAGAAVADLLINVNGTAYRVALKQ